MSELSKKQRKPKMLYIIRIVSVKGIDDNILRRRPFIYNKFKEDIQQLPFITVPTLRGLDDFEYEEIEYGYSRYMKRRARELNKAFRKFSDA